MVTTCLKNPTDSNDRLTHFLDSLAGFHCNDDLFNPSVTTTETIPAVLIKEDANDTNNSSFDADFDSSHASSLISATLHL